MCHSPGFGALQGCHWHEPWGDMNLSNSTKYLGLFNITRELQFADIELMFSQVVLQFNASGSHGTKISLQDFHHHRTHRYLILTSQF